MSVGRPMSGTVLISDWDQTATVSGGGSNEEVTHFGLDYFFVSPETVMRRYLVSGLAETLKSALDAGHTVMIATSQPFKQVIRRALDGLLGERAGEVVIACATPEKLTYVFKMTDPRISSLFASRVSGADLKTVLTFAMPLHTKNIEDFVVAFAEEVRRDINLFIAESQGYVLAELEKKWQRLVEQSRQALEQKCLAVGVDDAWMRLYSQEVWDVEQLVPMRALMDRLGVKNIRIIESEKEKFIWEKLKMLFPQPFSCQKIVYIDDSVKRLEAFRQLKPVEFAAASLECVVASVDSNQHYIDALVRVGSKRAEMDLQHLELLSSAEAAWLVEQLDLASVRLKKCHREFGMHPFFVGNAVIKTLPRTIVKIGDDRFMVINDRAVSASVGVFSKVKSQNTIKLTEDRKALVSEKSGLVKIHFKRKLASVTDWDSSKQVFIDRVKQEALMFARYNHLSAAEVCLRLNETHAGLRIYMSMPSLGVALSNASLLGQFDDVGCILIFYRTLESLAYLHAEGVAHFDLSLNNILYDEQSRCVHLCDFGHARSAGGPPLLLANKTIDPPVFKDASEDHLHFSTAYDIFSLGVSMAMWFGFPLCQQSFLKQAFYRSEGSPVFIVKSAYGGELGGDYADSGQDSAEEEGYEHAEQLFDFSKGHWAAQDSLIGLLREMMHPDPRQRPSATVCQLRLVSLGLVRLEAEEKLAGHRPKA